MHPFAHAFIQKIAKAIGVGTGGQASHDPETSQAADSALPGPSRASTAPPSEDQGGAVESKPKEDGQAEEHGAVRACLVLVSVSLCVGVKC